MEKGRRPHADTRTRILLAAKQAFLDRGYHGTSMRHIAEEAGVSLGGIYAHFSSKEEILRGLFAENPFGPVVQRLPQLLEETADLGEAVRRVARAVVDQLEAHRDYFRLLFVDVLEFGGAHAREAAAGNWRRVSEQVAPFLARRVTAGELRDLPPLLMVHALNQMLVSHVIFTHLLFPGWSPFGREEAVETLVDIFLHGVLPRGPERPASARDGGSG